MYKLVFKLTIIACMCPPASNLTLGFPTELKHDAYNIR